MLDVLNIGLMTADLIFANLERFPELGKESACEDFMIKPGGAVNTAAALACLGMDSTLITTLGRDFLGNYIFEYLRKMSMNTSGIIQDDKYRTPVSAVLSVGNERGFATYFSETDDEAVMKRVEALMPNCRHVHAYMFDCLHFPIIELAKKHNKTISMDTSWDESIKLKDLKPLMENCDIFFTNEIESCSITGKSSAEEAMDEIKKYTKLAVVKLGPQGSMISHEGNIFRVPAAQVDRVKDTTGAGDAFSAGFLYGYLNGWDIEKTAAFASASGSMAVTFYGGVDESYCLARVFEYMQRLDKKIA